MSKVGRNVSKIYPYRYSKLTGSLDSSFGQTIAQKLSIPIIPVLSPPQYPGPKPQPPRNEEYSNNICRSWPKKNCTGSLSRRAYLLES